MNLNRQRRSMLISATTLVATAFLFGACTSLIQTEGSRHHVYSSMDELIGDSQLAIEAVVSGEPTTEDVDGVTLTSVTLATRLQYFPGGLGLKPIDDGASRGAATLLTSNKVQLLQAGAPDAGPTPTLTAGRTYILFLTRSGLEGELADAYFVTGGVAGVYEAANDTTRFARTSKDDPALPAMLTRDLLNLWSPTRPAS